MAGSIRTNESCPLCDEAFQPGMIGNDPDLICPNHPHVRPRTYYIDARCKPFRTKKIYTDRKGDVFESHRAAHRQLEEMRAQVDRGTFDRTQWLHEKLREFKVSSEAEKWIERCRKDCSHSYWGQSKNVMRNYLVPAIGDMDVRDVRRYHLEAFKESLEKKGREPSSIKTWMDNVAAFFSWLVDREMIEKAPGIPPVPIPYKERPWIGRQQQMDILTKIAPRHHLIFETIIETGCRLGEICALRVRHVAGGEIRIEQALDATGTVNERKAGGTLYKTVPPELYAHLEAHAKGRFGKDPLFLNRCGNPYRSKGLWAIWRAAAKKADIDIAPYAGTRRSRASQIRERRTAEMMVEIGAELGNTPGMARRYARSGKERLSVTCPSEKMDPDNS